MKKVILLLAILSLLTACGQKFDSVVDANSELFKELHYNEISFKDMGKFFASEHYVSEQDRTRLIKVLEEKYEKGYPTFFEGEFAISEDHDGNIKAITEWKNEDNSYKLVKISFR